MLSWHHHESDPIWIYPDLDADVVNSIIKEFKIHPTIAEILAARGLTSFDEINSLLYSKLPDLLDPISMGNMKEAVNRVYDAIEQGENILIYGDNDVDGMTGVALLTEFLRYSGANVFFYLSNRTTLRKNLIVEALDYAEKNQCKLLITVDCGITAAQGIATVVERGVDVIITDHHEPTDTLPHCVATLNPKLLNSQYPNRDLTGVGVAFKLAHGVTNRLVSEGKLSRKKIDLKRYLDLVALGTISDMGILQGENRILVRYGLEQIKKEKRVGLAKLVSVCDIDSYDVNSFAVASKIAPRLNSLGRIDDPVKGVQMLLVKNAETAEKLALELDLNNIERQKIERMMSVDIEEAIKNDPDLLRRKGVVLSSNKWHPGVIAILSTRISKLYNRPTVMIAVEDGIGKGSVRSIQEFPLLNVLKESSDILMNFGGHDFAAGLTLKEEHIDEFKKRFIAAADKILTDRDVQSKMRLDAEVNFQDLTFDFMESLKLLEPFGNGNPAPVLYCEAKQAWPPKVIGSHLKLYLVQEEKDRMLEGIALYKAPYSKMLRKKDLVLKIAFTPQINDFQGQSIQLLIRDFQVKSPSSS